MAAFVRDPADIPPLGAEDLLNWVTSQKGSITTKWWTASTISVPVSDRSYYTSASQEVREYSPGRIIVVVDGVASTSGPLTIFADWSVTLSHASLERPNAPARPEVVTVLRNLYTKEGNTYLWSYGPNDSTGSAHPDKMFSEWRPGDLYLLNAGVTVEEYKQGSSGDAQTENYWVIHVESKTGCRWRINPDAQDSGLTASDAVMFCPRGTILRRVEKTPEDSGEELSLPSSRFQTSNGKISGKLVEACTNQLRPSGSQQLSIPHCSRNVGTACSQLTSDSKIESEPGTQLLAAVERLALALERSNALQQERYPECLSSESLMAQSGIQRLESRASEASQFEELALEQTEPTA